MATLNTVRDSDLIKQTGSGLAIGYDCDSSGGTLGSVVKLPIIKSSELKDITETENLKAEGKKEYPVTGSRKVTWECTFMQRDKATVKLAVETLRDKYIQIIKEVNSSKVGTNYQYYFFPICKIRPEVEAAGDSEEIKVTFDLLAVSSDVSNLAVATSDSGFLIALTSSQVTCQTSANTYWDMIETSV